MSKDIHDMNDEELHAKVEEVFDAVKVRTFEHLRAMERCNQIADPNIRLPLKFILENMK